MITLLTLLLVFGILGGLMSFIFKFTWGMIKFILGVFFIPAMLIALVVIGVKFIVIPALVIVAIVAIVKAITNKTNLC